jgi:predicted ATPase/DNA-binding winged helix-turn-helix (wHTH) protein
MHSVSDIQTAIDFGRFRVLPRRRELLADNQPVELGGRAFDVLMVLIEARGVVVRKETLMGRVWPDRVVDENNLPAQITALRRAFGTDRDLIRTVPGRGYQFTGEIRAAATSSDQPSILTTSAPFAASARAPTNLPVSISELIGREVELDEVLVLVASHRLVTLVGAGGIGKTRLGIEAARHLLPRFADGIWIVELAPLSDPELVPVAVATALGLELTSGAASPLSVASALRSKQLMLVLDNCEHMLDAAARVAEALLRANPAACVIATSREPLRAEGEWVCLVPPLAVPKEDGADSDDPLRYGSIRLFAERARAAAPTFSPDARLAGAMAGICRRLDGIPLAIELAAARVAALGINGLAARLDDRLGVLAGSRRTATSRHRTLRATLDWSYELLTEAERMVLRRLAIFVGGFTLQSATAVAAADDETAASDVVDCIASLVAKSLVTADAGGTVLRYRLLETTRAYLVEKLSQVGEFHTVAQRHAKRYVELFADAEAETETRPTDEWLAIYGPRIDNVRAALDWAYSPSGDVSIGVALTIRAVPLWVQLSLLGECRERAERALASLDEADAANARPRMQLSAALGWSLMYGVGRAREAGPAWAATLEIAERLDDKDYKQRALWGLCIDQFNNGEFHTALGYAERFAELVAGSNDPVDLVMGDRILATALHYIGDQKNARLHIDRVLEHLAALAQQPHIVRLRFDMRVSTHYFQARILWLQGFADQALRVVEHNVDEGRSIGHALSFCSVLGQGACPIAFLAGDFDVAARYGAMLLDHTERHPMRLWQLWARCFNGMVMAQRGEVTAGLHVLRRELEQAGDAKFLPRFLLPLGQLAACLGEAGEITEGLAIVDDALARCKARAEGWYLAELIRIRGELILDLGGSDAAAKAEGEYLSALDCARRQGALSWELRTATSLARLLRDQGRLDGARHVLASVYGQFTEGFATADLRTAKALLDDLT